MKENDSIRRIIRLLIEEMGHVDARAGRGWGTSSPKLVKSTRMSLGHVNTADDLSSDEDDGPVKISKVFKQSS